TSRFLGTREECTPAGTGLLPGEIHYFKGNTAVRGARRYHELWYENLYDNIHLRYYGTEKEELKYDFVLLPGANSAEIRIQLDGVEKVNTNAAGELEILTAWGTISDAAPYAYQIVGGKEVSVAVRYKMLDNSSYGFEINGPYDPSLALIVDPLTLNWCTFFHSNTSDDYVMAVTRDADNNMYITGYTKSLTFPITPGIYQNVYGGGIDNFVAKFNPSGTSLIFSTYIGGNDWELSYGIGTDSQRRVYIAGYGRSANYPITSGSDQPLSGGGLAEGFITCLTPAGDSLVYSSFFGGSDRDYIYDLEVHDNGDAWVTGYTLSNDLPVSTGAYQESFAGGGDAFVVKYSSGGNRAYSTYLGGSGYDIANAVRVNAAGEVYVAGTTSSYDLPVSAGAYQGSPNFVPGLTEEDAFIYKLSASGGSLVYGTYMGGSDSDVASGLDINTAGEAFITGTTYSTDLPVSVSAFQALTGGGGDAFAARISATGTSLGYCTYLGGSSMEMSKSVRVNADNEAFLFGSTLSAAFPVTSGSASYVGQYDLFLSVLLSDGSALKASALYGGTYNEYPRANGAIYLKDNQFVLVATTHSPDIQMTGGAYQSVKTNGTADAPWLMGGDLSTVLEAGGAGLEAVWSETRQLTQLRWTAPESAEALQAVVERKAPGENWTSVFTCETAPGALRLREWEDASEVFSGEIRLYRVRFVSASGETGYTAVVQVEIPDAGDLGLSLSPNPARGPATLRCRKPEAVPAEISIYDAQGRRVWHEADIRSADIEYALNVGAWGPGLYMVRVSAPGLRPLVRKWLVM
ncbi:MAG: hypothetical protein EAZ89_18110, partial [Bacteroidetes bacterium]